MSRCSTWIDGHRVTDCIGENPFDLEPLANVCFFSYVSAVEFVSANAVLKRSKFKEMNIFES